MQDPANDILFSRDELERYSRHLLIPEFNLEGQRKLKQARVLVVGTGGLGAPLLLYLTAAGVGTIGIVDFDVVDASNLQRQVLFTTADIGRPKVEAARDRLAALNPHVQFEVHNMKLEAANALSLIGRYDVVADGTDNFPTRYLVNDACVLAGKVNVYASIFRFEGQLSVFNYRFPDGSRGPNYRDLFPTPPPPGMVPSCAEGGVIGVLPGILGSLQANEVIKVISGVGEPMAGRLFQFDAALFSTRILKLAKDPDNPLTGDHPTLDRLIDYEAFCSLGDHRPSAQSTDIRELSVAELKTWMETGRPFHLIDVREPFEYAIANLGGTLIPKATALDRIEAFARPHPVVVLCKSGIRSRDVIHQVRQRTGLTELYNVTGGINAWAREIDPAMVRY